MPKRAAYRVTWSPQAQVYEVYSRDALTSVSITPDSPAWLSWLEEVSSFAFHSRDGHHCTVRKQRFQRGGAYWYAYRSTPHKLLKRYLGRSADLTLASLEEAACLLSTADSMAQPEELTALEIRQEQPDDQEQRPASMLAQTSLTGEEGVPGSERTATVASAMPPFPDVLLSTKLHPPRAFARLVPRVRLLEDLQQGVERPLTLLCAPAGFGKTTLLVQWLAQSRMPVAWLSLEPRDNDPARFLSYLIAALQTVNSAIGGTALALLHSASPPSPETVLSLLINDLAAHAAGDVALVLDDYHTLTNATIGTALTFLLEHQPPQLHLILATRADPALPLARLRARGQLTEVRAAQLQFGEEETRTFLHEVMGLDLSSQEVAVLQQRTEGWIAGLQLAALSLQGRADRPQFLADFSGSHRHLVDYLVEEVLARQPQTVQAFLLHTSILDRLSAPLCDAVTESRGSEAMLDVLERANLFLLPLDGQRQWYRYHHLFADVLQHFLQQQQAELVPVLHRRASAWYEQQGFIREAVEHALAAQDFERTADLIEHFAADTLMKRGEVMTVQRWLEALPHDVLRAHVLLYLTQGWALAIFGHYEGASVLLAHVEQALQMHATPSPRLSRSELQGEVAGLRAFLAFRRGELPGTIILARQSLEQTASSSTSRGFVAWCLGVAYGLSGNIRAAIEAQTEARLIGQAQGNDYATFLATFELASFQALQGHLHHAQQLYHQALQLTSASQGTLPASGSALVGLGCLEYEWNHLEAAAQLLREGITRCMQIGAANAIMQGYDRLAWVKQAQGDATGARALFAEAMQIPGRYHLTQQRLAQLEARRVRLLLTQGDVAEALRWVQSCEVSSEDEDDYRLYQREIEYLTLVRVYLSQQEFGEAVRLLRRLLPVAQAQGRRGSVLEMLMLQALIYQAQGETARAVVTLEKALVQAEPEGYVRLFVDEGAPMAALLQQVLAHWKTHRHASYVRSLLQAFEQQGHSAPSQRQHQPQGALEPLSQRERTVLGLLAAGLSNPEIAEELVVSRNTIKTQISSLYRKLNARNRKEAIAIAQRWHLL